MSNLKVGGKYLIYYGVGEVDIIVYVGKSNRHRSLFAVTGMRCSLELTKKEVGELIEINN